MSKNSTCSHNRKEEEIAPADITALLFLFVAAIAVCLPFL